MSICRPSALRMPKLRQPKGRPIGLAPRTKADEPHAKSGPAAGVYGLNNVGEISSPNRQLERTDDVLGSCECQARERVRDDAESMVCERRWDRTLSCRWVIGANRPMLRRCRCILVCA